MAALIETHELSKYFVHRTGLIRRRTESTVKAVDRLTLTVHDGEFVGLLGPNGAGKSTTIKMLAGILHPSHGFIQIAGLSPVRQRVQLALKLGIVLGQRSQLWWDLPLRDSFDILHKMYRVDRAAFRQRLEELNGLLNLSDFWQTPVRQLSLGQRMRGELAAALLHHPRLLVLDEPTIGLDVEAKAAVRTFLQNLNRQRGTTVILTTHDMSDVQELCRRVVVINHGRAVFDGPLTALHHRVGVPTSLSVTFARAVGERDTAGLADPGWHVRLQGPFIVVAEFNRSHHNPWVVLERLKQLGEIVDIRMQEPQLDRVIRLLLDRADD